MFMFIGLGINAVVLLMLFGVYSKLDEISRAIRSLAPADTALPTTSLEPSP